jgi:hypothetical protein
MREYCELHGKLMDTIDRIELKLDAISERQTDYIERTVKIEGIVTNGLALSVKHMRDQLDKFCGEAERRLVEIEKFSWFRQWMTGLRDNLFQNILRLILVGGGIYMIVRFGNEIIKGILK